MIPPGVKMGCRRTDCLSRPLSNLFEKLGSAVGSCPFYFFIIPILITAALSGGFIFLKDRDNNDLELQFTPKKGPSKVTRAFVRQNFPYNTSMFSEDRLYDKGSFASLIAASKNSDNILESPVIEDIIRLNEKILNISVDIRRMGFSELCAKVNDKCFSNIILEIVGSNETSRTGITYPEHRHGSSLVFLGSALGGVLKGANNTIQKAQAVKLYYYLNNQESAVEASKLWLKGFKNVLSDEMDGKHIDVCITVLLFFHIFSAT